MYLADELFRTVRDPNLPQADLERFVALEATLATFITSRTIDPQYVCLLSPTSECVWEIRAVKPDPSIRVFGFFAERDSFVATNYELRKELDCFESELWIHHKTKARSVWRKLFNSLLPSAETDAKLLITGALDGQYFK
jgi:hypothetical protein